MTCSTKRESPKKVSWFSGIGRRSPSCEELCHGSCGNSKLYNAYQQTQGKVVEKAMKKAEYVASFIGHEPGKALFVGLYKNAKPPKDLLL